MTVVLKKGVFIVAAKRTPFAKMGKLYKDTHPSNLLAIAAKETFKEGNIDPSIVDTVNVGQVYNISGSCDGFLTPRHAALKAEIPQGVPALGVNCLCGSGFQAVINSALDIVTGSSGISLAGGTENMSAIPFLVRNSRFGVPLGLDNRFEDYMLSGSLDTYCNLTMAQTSEKLAEMYNLRREELDLFAFKSQQKWKAAYDKGVFKNEIAPVTVIKNGETILVENDEQPRPETTMEVLSKLPARFKTNGFGTVGNCTGIADGAGAVILASENAVKQHHLTPLVRISGWSNVGVEPSLMGLGPVPAINHLLDEAGLTLDDMDMVEINEPFAAQTVASIKELEVDESKVNINGGAIAMGHPPAATGARITAHLAHELRRRGMKRGIGSTCIGGGQGIALLVEAV